ncbi:MAG: DUF3021 domain-containing protein [Lachnospiraceae bacterium]|nr:DUF3021 domain-containing protein [Lachnospiraceae bacterium]
MKKNIKDFCIRGLMFAWGGPAITAIIWYFLGKAGQIEALSPAEVLIGVLSTSALAFIAAGISIVHQIETIPKLMASLIQGAVLYIDYLGFYLLNGWIKTENILIFSICFVVGFVIIWACVYIPIRIRVAKMNKKLGV